MENALRFTAAKVLGLDFSLASLGYAKRKLAELNVGNADLVHANLLDAHALEQRFDLIECIGVLHHLNSAAAGLEVLAGLLKPRGLMRIGLYSSIARRNICLAQRFIAEEGFPSTRTVSAHVAGRYCAHPAGQSYFQ